MKKKFNKDKNKIIWKIKKILILKKENIKKIDNILKIFNEYISNKLKFTKKNFFFKKILLNGKLKIIPLNNNK